MAQVEVAYVNNWGGHLVEFVFTDGSRLDASEKQHDALARWSNGDDA